MAKWIKKNWFLIALALVYAAGHFGYERLSGLASASGLRSAIVFSVMWFMGITLRPDAIVGSVRRPTAGLLAITSNVFLVPLLCLSGWWCLPRELAGGLFVAGLVPCTLASASVWTRKAGGDDSVSMMTTAVTNLSCVLVVPIGIRLGLSSEAGGDDAVSALPQMMKLFWFVVLPLLIAQVMRRRRTFVGALGDWADRNKGALSMLAQFGILAMVLFGAIASRAYVVSNPDPSSSSSFASLLMLCFVTIVVHLVAFRLAVSAAQACRLPREQQIAVGIAGSQKTLMIGLQIAIDCGVSVLPMMIYHAGQLVVDTIIVDRWPRSAQSEPLSKMPIGTQVDSDDSG